MSKSNAKKSKAPVALRLPVRASVWYTASGIIARGITFILTPLFTRILSEADFGIYALYTSVFSFLTTLMTLGVGGVALYGGFAKYKGRESDLAKSALLALFFVFSFFAVPFFIFIKPISSLFGLPLVLTFVIALHVISDGAVSILGAKDRYFYSYKRVFFIGVSGAIISSLFSIIIIGKLPSLARSLGAAFSSAAVCAYLLFSFRKVRAKANGEMIRHVILTSLSILPATVATVFISSLDKLMIAKLYGSSALAKYSVAHSLGLLLSSLSVGIYGSLKPWIARKLAAGKVESVKTSISALFRFFAVLTAAFALVIPEVLSFLAPVEYLEAIFAVYVFALCVLPMFLVGVLSSVLIFKGRSYMFSIAAVGAAVINAALNALALGRASYVFASVAFLIAYVLLFILCRIFAGRQSVFGKDVYLFLLITAAVLIPIYLLRQFQAVRYLLLFCTVIPLFYMSKKALAFIKEK